MTNPFKRVQWQDVTEGMELYSGDIVQNVRHETVLLKNGRGETFEHVNVYVDLGSGEETHVNGDYSVLVAK